MHDSAVLPTLIRDPAAGGFVRSNAEFGELSGLCSESLGKASFLHWIAPQDQDAVRKLLQEGSGSCTARHRNGSGATFPLKVRVRAEGGQTTVFAQAITTCPLGREEDDPRAEATVKGTLRKIARIVEDQNPGYRCSILLVAHGRFVSGAGPSLPDEYNEAIDGYAIGPTVGSCGTAIYWNTPVVVSDIQEDPLWAPFAELAERAGVAACWSHPFSTKSGKVLGALALYSPTPRSPTAEQMSRLAAAAQMTGLAVERGRAEEELRAASRVKSRFLANMSHEIRTPLNALIGISEQLCDESGGQHTEEVALLKSSGEQLLELFTGVLEMTEVRNRKAHDEIVDFTSVCHEILLPLREQAREKGLSFQFLLDAELPTHVRTDRWCLERALRNVVHNAVKFTASGLVRVELRTEGPELQVRVRDSGEGLDLNRVQDLRAPFIQGDLTSTKRHAGFGLGLALADLCLATLGGKLSFEAAHPCGTEATLRIPLQAVASDLAEITPLLGLHSPQPSGPLLVVEDNALNRKVIGTLLRRAGHDCEFAENGKEGLEAYRQGHHAGILMDCQMPVMDGYEAAIKIRESEAASASGERTPIIAVTANALAGDEARCLDAGMDHYLKKPVRAQELLRTLAECGIAPGATPS